jgi:8-oxo-dGTP pyrophosphatase MutT (NUDIX family)
MYFVQKIYYNNKPLILTNDAASYLRAHPVAAGYLSFTGAFARNYRLAIDHLDKPRTMGAIIEDLSPKSLQAQLHQLYTPIDAAGGVVKNERDEVLMIYRRGKWDLPKGKRDDGEDMATCALREVSEETGLKQVKLGEHICDTYHVYTQHNKSLLKRTAWYHMKASVKETLEPQAEENILEARWIQEAELAPVVFKTYDAIKEVLQEAGLSW